MTSPAGSSSNSEPDVRLVLRPRVLKTLVKGSVAIAIFSLFLEIASNVLNYFIFLALSFSMVGLYMLVKHGSKFMIGDDNIEIKRLFRKSNTVNYTDIYDLSVAQGFLAKRFGCGSVYMILKQGRGGVNLMGGGTAERLDDVQDPNHLFELISSKLSPF